MSNVKTAPAWLAGGTADAVMGGLDRAAAENAFRAIGLSGREIVAIERIAAVRNMTPEACAGELVRVAVAAIRAGGMRC